MSLLDRTADAAFEPVAVWALPENLDEFMDWLREAVDGANDAERVERFLTYPAAVHMPTRLRAAIERGE